MLLSIHTHTISSSLSSGLRGQVAPFSSPGLLGAWPMSLPAGHSEFCANSFLSHGPTCLSHQTFPPQVPRKQNWPFPSSATIKALSSLRFQMFKGVGSTPNFAFLPHTSIWLLSLPFLNFSHDRHQKSPRAKMQLTFFGPYLPESVYCAWLSWPLTLSKNILCISLVSPMLCPSGFLHLDLAVLLLYGLPSLLLHLKLPWR